MAHWLLHVHCLSTWCVNALLTKSFMSAAVAVAWDGKWVHESLKFASWHSTAGDAYLASMVDDGIVDLPTSAFKKSAQLDSPQILIPDTIRQQLKQTFAMKDDASMVSKDGVSALTDSKSVLSSNTNHTSTTIKLCQQFKDTRIQNANLQSTNTTLQEELTGMEDKVSEKDALLQQQDRNLIQQSQAFEKQQQEFIQLQEELRRLRESNLAPGSPPPDPSGSVTNGTSPAPKSIQNDSSGAQDQ